MAIPCGDNFCPSLLDGNEIEVPLHNSFDLTEFIQTTTDHQQSATYNPLPDFLHPIAPQINDQEPQEHPNYEDQIFDYTTLLRTVQSFQEEPTLQLQVNFD